MNNLQLQKDSSFNRSFERENGFNFYLFGQQNKLMRDNSLNRSCSINKNGSVSQAFNPYKKESKQPINLFVELADESNNDKNDEFMNLNILQKNNSSVRPMMFKDKSCNSSFSLNVNTGNEHLLAPTPIKPKLEEKPSIEFKFNRQSSALSSLMREEIHRDSEVNRNHFVPRQPNLKFPVLERHLSGPPENNAFNVYNGSEVCSFGKANNTKGLVLKKEISSDSSESEPRAAYKPSFSRTDRVKYEDYSTNAKPVDSRQHTHNIVDYADKWVVSQMKNFSNTNYNWNNEVEGLLEEVEEDHNKMSIDQPIKSKPSKSTKKSANVSIRRHRKKSKKQLDTLESHFDVDLEWSLELVEQLASDLCLEKDQVYKWNWDKRKRLRRKAERESKSNDTSKKNKRQKID